MRAFLLAVFAKFVHASQPPTKAGIYRTIVKYHRSNQIGEIDRPKIRCVSVGTGSNLAQGCTLSMAELGKAWGLGPMPQGSQSAAIRRRQ